VHRRRRAHRKRRGLRAGMVGEELREISHETLTPTIYISMIGGMIWAFGWALVYLWRWAL
jgi:hypothetical protein